MVNDKQRSTENENKNKQANTHTHTRIRQGFGLTSWGELFYILHTTLGCLLVLKVLSQLPAAEDQPLWGSQNPQFEVLYWNSLPVMWNSRLLLSCET